MRAGDILESIKPVVGQSKYVAINRKNLKKVCAEFKSNDSKSWLTESPFELSRLKDDQRLNFIFVFDSVNFCYWGQPKWTINYRGENYDGAWGMMGSIKKALDRGLPILKADYLSSLKKKDLALIWKGNIPIPLFFRRWAILRENGRILQKKYQGQFLEVIRKSNKDALSLLSLITADFPSFNDRATFKGKKVLFYKRAQLAVADIYRCFKGRGWGNLKNIGQLTAAADYKIPQVLRKLGILKYSPELAGKIDSQVQILPGSEEEIEIRANMIWAIEQIKEELKKKIPQVTSMEIDSYLWLLGQNKSPDDKPYHLTRTIYY
ncbi:MAG: queuosine salvage family protein [Candidatus Pacebacteria bacterium]|nr:queuosine salvage family protein [Candidatus Paceibacterota bacterium]